MQLWLQIPRDLDAHSGTSAGLPTVPRVTKATATAVRYDALCTAHRGYFGVSDRLAWEAHGQRGALRQLA